MHHDNELDKLSLQNQQISRKGNIAFCDESFTYYQHEPNSGLDQSEKRKTVGTS
jgi:hypothetical protein